jgi:hypothetical protein
VCFVWVRACARRGWHADLLPYRPIAVRSLLRRKLHTHEVTIAMLAGNVAHSSARTVTVIQEAL